MIFFCRYFIYFFIMTGWGIDGAEAQNLKNEYPIGLLSEDYGILKEKDLVFNSCEYQPQTFPPKPYTTPFHYWQCFSSKTMSLHCEKTGLISNVEGQGALVVLDFFQPHEEFHFIENRPWPLWECRTFIKDLKNISQGESHVCVSASFLNYQSEDAKIRKSNWLFEKMKTKKGCEGRHCNINPLLLKRCDTWDR